MTPRRNVNGTSMLTPGSIDSPDIKRGSWVPMLPIPADVIYDLRQYLYMLIEKKEWASRQMRDIAREIINANESETDDPRFYSLDIEGEYYKRVLGECGGDYNPEWQFDDYPVPSNEKVRLVYHTVRRAIQTYRFNILETFKEDLAPYIQEALVEAIKNAGKDPKILKIILDALKPSEKVKPDDTEDTHTTEFIEVRDRLRVGGHASKGAGLPATRPGLSGYESSMRSHPGKRGRPADGVVPRGDDPGMDAPPNIIEVEGGSYPNPKGLLEDDIFDYGREYLGDTEEPEHSDTGELSSTETDDKSAEVD